MSRSCPFFLLILLLGILTPVVRAQVPETVAYQGYLTDARGNPLDGTFTLTFRLYDEAAAGSVRWLEKQPRVTVTNGVFSVSLGSETALSDLSFDQPLWLSIAVGDVGAEELTPRVALGAVPYALSLRGFRVEPTDPSRGPNLIGGYRGNQVAEGVRGGTISGGGQNEDEQNVDGDFGTVGGGRFNTAGEEATVGGGASNRATATHATVGGGFDNVAEAPSATVGGGSGNTATGNFGTVGGGLRNRASNGWATVAGGEGNVASNGHATVSGGEDNTAAGSFATVGGGQDNTSGGFRSTIGGGRGNAAAGFDSVISGGQNNTAGGDRATVAGGQDNTANGDGATVNGGSGNTASGDHATIGGGRENTASGDRATVPGGRGNEAAGDHSFAAGRRARVEPTHRGTFLFADANDVDFTSAAANEFAVRAVGGVRLVSSILGSDGSPVAGVRLPTGGSAWQALSDRNAKENFQPVDGRAVVQRLAEIPVETWNYKAQGAAVRHIGPMAQDFYAAFGVGEDDRHITTIDADGVALAAIQGLYQIIREQQAQIDALRALIGRMTTTP